jgi:hypothetical protein
MFWMPVEDPVFSGDHVRHDESEIFKRSSKFHQPVSFSMKLAAAAASGWAET